MIKSRERLPNKDNEQLTQLEQALIAASTLPYNNATNIYETAGETPDLRMGGSCLFKLNHLRSNLSRQILDRMFFVTSQINQTIHYAAVAELGNEHYYCDPFLWQQEPMLLSNELFDVECIHDNWRIHREPDQEGTLFAVSFRELKADGTTLPLVIHRFLNQFPTLPSSSAIPITPHVPTFKMQVPDREGKMFYKFTYHKKERRLGAVFAKDCRTGEVKKITDDRSQTQHRIKVLADIERILGMSVDDIERFFSRALDLELQLQHLLPTLGTDVPGGSNEE